MKNILEEKFSIIVKKGLHEVLKPLGFERKGSSFFLTNSDYSKLINLQRSKWNSGEHINFTINIGLFIPEYLHGFSNNIRMNSSPFFPRIEECFISKRIGDLIDGYDVWYDINLDSNVDLIINEVTNVVKSNIIPYFDQYSSKGELLNALDRENFRSRPFVPLIIYGELQQMVKFEAEYSKLRESLKIQSSLEMLEDYVNRYRGPAS